MKVLDVAWGWSAADDSWLSRSIRYFTRPNTWNLSSRAKWSHMYLVFSLEGGQYELHEALGSRGWCSCNVRDLINWHNAKPLEHKIEVHWLGIEAEDATKIYNASCDFLGLESYAFKQIASFALTKSLLGRVLGLARLLRGCSGVICSEMATKLVGLNVPFWDIRANKKEPWDYISPQEAYERYLRKVGQDGN